MWTVPPSTLILLTHLPLSAPCLSSTQLCRPHRTHLLAISQDSVSPLDLPEVPCSRSAASCQQHRLCPERVWGHVQLWGGSLFLKTPRPSLAAPRVSLLTAPSSSPGPLAQRAAGSDPHLNTWAPSRMSLSSNYPNVNMSSTRGSRKCVPGLM